MPTSACRVVMNMVYRAAWRCIHLMMIATVLWMTSLAYSADATISRKPESLLLIWAPTFGNMKMPPLLHKRLSEAGWKKTRVVQWEQLSPTLLHDARAVVTVRLPLCMEPTEQDQAIVELLKDYVSKGGGLLLTHGVQEMPVCELPLSNLIAKAFGTQILFEPVEPDPTKTKCIGQWGENDRYTFTDRVFEPVNAGIRGVCFHSSCIFGAIHGAMPFVPSAPWRVVLSAGPKSRTSIHTLGLDAFDKEMRTVGYASNVPLAGVRDFGKGRVAYVGMAGFNIFARPLGSEESEKTYETYMTKGWDGCPSDQLKFYENTLAWISANAVALSQTELKMPALTVVPRSTKWKLLRGVVGPRTIYSSGFSSPDEYVKKAKELGLDFVVFLEDFASLKPAGFDNLKQACRRLSDATFLALAGFTYQDTNGNHQYIFSDCLQLPSARLIDPTNKRFKVFAADLKGGSQYVGLYYTYGLLGFNNTPGWYNFSRNPYAPYDTRDVDSMAVVTQEDGKVIDREIRGYGINNRNSQSLHPLALCLAKSAAELDGVRDGRCYFNIIGANGIDQIGRCLTKYEGMSISHLYPGMPPFGQTSISNGPVIELVMPRADVSAEKYLYDFSLQQWPLSLSVMSENGLKEVTILDGDEAIRRFLPNGKKAFSFRTSLGKERQKHIWVHATDVKGREAISRAINCNSWLLRECQCGDRNNQLLYSRQVRPDGTAFYLGYGGDTCTPDKGPWNGRIRPVGCYVFDEKYGVGSIAFDGSPEAHPQCLMNPCMMYDGKMPKKVGWLHHLVAEHEGAAHVLPHRVVASSEVLIGDRVLDGVFPLEAENVGLVWHSVFPFTPSKFLKMSARTTFYLVKPDGVTFYLWDQTIELLKDVPNPTSSPWFFRVGSISNINGQQRVMVSRGKTIDQGKAIVLPVQTTAFNRGDYIGHFKNPFGSLAVYSLTDGLVLQGDGFNSSVGIKPTGPVMKAGTKLRIRLLMVGMHREVADPLKLAAQIKLDYGICTTPKYAVTAQTGKVVDTEYVLTLSAAPEGCFVGSVRGVAALPGNLGSATRGLNDRWTAWFQLQGEKPKTRIVPVAETIAYAVLREEDDGQTVFIGHPMVADRRELVLNVARDENNKKWLLEVHNPTDQAISSVVRSSPYVKGIHFKEEMRIEPATSFFRDLGP